MRRSPAFITVLLAIAGCSAAGPGVPFVPSPTPVAIASPAPDQFCPTTPPPSIAPADVAADRVTGTWLGTSSEPQPEWLPVSACGRRAYELRLTQAGSALEGEVAAIDNYWYLFDQALVGMGNLRGTLTDGRMVLDGTADTHGQPGAGQVHYDMTYDGANRWFKGTINGKPAWLLPMGTQSPCPTQRPCDPVV